MKLRQLEVSAQSNNVRVMLCGPRRSRQEPKVLTDLAAKLRAEGLAARFPEIEAGAGAMVGVLEGGVLSNDILIADVTGADPTVMYLVGYANGARKPVLLIAQQSDDPVPAVLAAKFVLYYAPGQTGKLASDLAFLIPKLVAGLAA